MNVQRNPKSNHVDDKTSPRGYTYQGQDPSVKSGVKNTRVLIADNHEIVRHGVRDLVESHEGLTVCGEVGTGREAVSEAKRLKPDVVIMAISMSELNGIEATRQIRQALKGTEVVVFTRHETEELVRQVLDAGARGYVLKSDAKKYLLAAIEAVREHRVFFSARVSRLVLDGYLKKSEKTPKGKNLELTPREREIIQLVAEGRSTKEVAQALGISTKTAETHRHRLMSKRKLHNISEVVRYAIRNHIIQP